jgi:predicted phage tail protein
MSIGNIVVVAIFSLVGFAAFRYGRKNDETRPMLLGAALMVYGYFISNAWLSLVVGGVLTALIFFPR